jgi:hypothetical protein
VKSGSQLSASKARAHEEAIQKFAQQKGLSIEPLPYAIKLTDGETQDFSIIRNPALNKDEQPGLDGRLFPVSIDDSLTGATELHEFAAALKSQQEYEPSQNLTEEEQADVDRLNGKPKSTDILSTYHKDQAPVRTPSKTYPKKLIGPTDTRRELIKSKIRGGGYAVKPRTKELDIPFDRYKLQNSASFLNTLSSDELDLNAAKQDPGFRIEDFALKKGWKIGPAKRLQTAFNKKFAKWKEEEFIDPNMEAPLAEETVVPKR